MNLRKLISLTHLWLGLPLALYAVLIGLSGAIIVFKDDLNVWLHPELHPGGDPVFQADPDRVLAELATQYPGWRPLSFSWPHDETRYWMVFLLKGPQSLHVFIDTSSGKIVGTHDPKSGWLGWVETLHTNLRFGRDGRLANGYFALGLLLLSLSGAFLVWPRLRTLSLRDIRQWHYSLGTFTFFFLFGLAFTGAYYTWSRTYIEAVKATLGRGSEPTLPKLDRPTTTTLPIWQLMDLAQRAYPGKAIHRFPIPDAKFPLRVTFRESSFAAFHQVSSVTLDPRTGAVLRVQPLAQRHPGDSFLGWLSGFHFGVFGGRPVQILWALVGLAIAALGPTGVWIWWRKRPQLPAQRMKSPA
jgi:uncharacterized iron-regulated membrane protein